MQKMQIAFWRYYFDQATPGQQLVMKQMAAFNWQPLMTLGFGLVAIYFFAKVILIAAL